MAKYVGHKPIHGKRIDPVKIVRTISYSADNTGYLKTLRKNMQADGLVKAVQNRDNQALFDWLMGCFSYQGISDAVADSYIKQHGNATYLGVSNSLVNLEPHCPKLTSFEAFSGCGYKKSAASCNNPSQYASCPVANQNLRKGQLNQAAFSLYLFIRDVCKGDLIDFIDQALAEPDLLGHPDRLAMMRESLTSKFNAIFGVAQKLISMTFADLLIGSDPKRSRWVEVGSSMVAVDSLVHNFMHRTGILYQYGAEHGLGSACYGKNGCAGIIDQIARHINCSTIDHSYPVYFPRFIQFSIWRYCAGNDLGICNGNKINDAFRCNQQTCVIYENCGRVTLKPN